MENILEKINDEIREKVIKINQKMSSKKINKTNALRFYGLQTGPWYNIISGKTRFWRPSFKQKFLSVIYDFEYKM